MSINVQAYGAPARLTLRDYQIAGTAVTPQVPLQAPPAKTLDQYTPSDTTAAATNPYSGIMDSLRLAAMRRDAAPPGVAKTDRAVDSTADSAIAEVEAIDAA